MNKLENFYGQMISKYLQPLVGNYVFSGNPNAGLQLVGGEVLVTFISMDPIKHDYIYMVQVTGKVGVNPQKHNKVFNKAIVTKDKDLLTEGSNEGYRLLEQAVKQLTQQLYSKLYK
jgi:hypothetical protein